MANFIQGKSLRLMEYGAQVLKAAQALPQTATATLFTVTGGRVIVTSLVGTVSTAIQNQACSLSLGTVPTTGTASATGLTTAVTTIANLEVGTHLYLPAAKGALVANANAGAAAQLFAGSAYVVSAGTISWTTSASNTGAISWALTYIPLDDGAAVS
jgi:hypothetical protein